MMKTIKLTQILLFIALFSIFLIPSDGFSETPFIKHNEPYYNDVRYSENSLFGRNANHCRTAAKCESLNVSTKCMGAKLPYDSTTFLTDLDSQIKVQEKLQLYQQYLQFIPRCWSVIQPFLCALYMPKCENGEVHLPSKEMCNITLKPCMILKNHSLFTEIFNCNFTKLFPSQCKNDIHKVKFNITGSCMDPLIKTDDSDRWFKNVEGCGLKCKDLRYRDSDLSQIRKFILYGSLICILMHIFIIITFLINWSAAKQFPAKAIFYVNICYFISNGGYFISAISSNVREDIVCKKDGTLRKSEPDGTENLSCVAVFVLVYYFFIAGLVWFMIFTYVWYMNTFQASGKSQNRVDKKPSNFHLVAWCIPLILTITIMGIEEIDGDYITGICFVGLTNLPVYVGFFLAPLVATMLISLWFILCGLSLLIKLKSRTIEVISQHVAEIIQSNIRRMAIFTILMVLFVMENISYHFYVASNKDLWYTSLENYVLCKLTSFSSEYLHCKHTDRPSVARLQVHLIAIFGQGFSIVVWILCKSTLHAWSRFIKRRFNNEEDEPMKATKHKVIARAFAGRKKFNKGGKVMIFCQNHTDPVGLKFELEDSVGIDELRRDEWSTFAKTLPRLLNRRNAEPENIFIYNNDSEISVSYQKVNIESRRNSGDSQLSVQIAELVATKRVKSRRPRHSDRDNNTGTSRSPSPSGSKRGSSLSLDSHSHILNALTQKNNGAKNFEPNLNRRTATAGLDGEQIRHLLSDFLKNSNLSGSDEENVAVTYSETAINMKVSENQKYSNLDLNDQLTIRHLKKGTKIYDYSSESEDEADDDEEHYRKFSSESECDSESSSSCDEIKQLAHNDRSLNSNNFSNNDFFDKNTTVSRQSKNSTDVAVQANGYDLDLEMNNKKIISKKEKIDKNKENNKRYKTTGKKSTIENNSVEEKMRKSKGKYKNDGTNVERCKLKDLV